MANATLTFGVDLSQFNAALRVTKQESTAGILKELGIQK